RLRSRAFYAAMELGESDSVRGLLPEGLQARVRRKIRGGRSSFKNDLLEAIDWTRTKAFFPGVPIQGIVVVRQGAQTPGGVADEGERRAVLDRLIRELRALEGPDGLPVIDEVWQREELYSGPYVSHAPDLVFVARDYACLGRPVLGARSWFRDCSKTPHGFHRMGGVWMAYGEGVEPGAEVAGAQIADVTPTVLHAMGEAVPDDMDGRVLSDSFREDWWRKNPPRYCEAASLDSPSELPLSSGDDEGLKERLRALGYLD
ncbi:MAG: hypothetical protein VX498_04115, partial [Myxococcota bacterium]|nr:hypothetical protein [Myxococcota bacterium]